MLFMIAVNTTAINTALNSIAGDISIGSTELAWAVGIYLLCVAAFVVPGGRLGDLIGQRGLAITGLVVYAGAAVVVAGAATGWELIAGRLFQGLGAAALMPCTMAVLRLVYPTERQGYALGVWGAIGGLGFALGPVIGGAVTDLIGWRWIWWGTVLMGALLLLWATVLLRGLPRPAERPRFDVSGLVLLATGLFLVMLAIQQGSVWGWATPPTLGAFALGVATLATLVAVELRKDEPLLHIRLLRNRALIGASVGTAANAVQLLGVLFFFNIYAQASVTLDLSAVMASVALLPFGACVFAASLLTGRVCDRVGFRWPVAVGLLMMAIGCGALGLVDLAGGYSALWWGLLVSGIGVGITFSAPAAAGLRALPAKAAGEAAGLVNVARYLAAALVVAIGTVIFTTAGSGTMNRELARAGVAPAEQATLDTTLTGSPTHYENAAATLQGEERTAFSTAATAGLASGFHAVALAMGLAALVGGLAWVLLMRRDGLTSAGP
jgi:EmrB/QacA subfamily drug resistance transporter